MTLRLPIAPALAAVSAALVFATAAVAQEPVEFDYEGARGPAFWGTLSPAFATCSEGRRQSPIDLRRAVRPRRAPRIRLRYRPTALELENNGHTWEARPEESQTMRIGRKRFELVQFHPHSPSEHRLRGRRFGMELHFVHQAADGRRAVLGAFVKRGRRNRVYRRVASRVPRQPGGESRVHRRVNLAGLLPGSRRAYRYAGSLTTPPCTQGIRWVVLRKPIELSRGQIAAFRRMLGRNARPTQPRYGRRLTLR